MPYEIGVSKFEELAKGQMLGVDTGLLKLLFDPKTPQAPRRPHLRRARDRDHPHRPGGARLRRHDRLLPRRGLQLPDDGRGVQGRGPRRAEPAVAIRFGVAGPNCRRESSPPHPNPLPPSGGEGVRLVRSIVANARGVRSHPSEARVEAHAAGAGARGGGRRSVEPASGRAERRCSARRARSTRASEGDVLERPVQIQVRRAVLAPRAAVSDEEWADDRVGDDVDAPGRSSSPDHDTGAWYAQVLPPSSETPTERFLTMAPSGVAQAVVEQQRAERVGVSRRAGRSAAPRGGTSRPG